MQSKIGNLNISEKKQLKMDKITIKKKINAIKNLVGFYLIAF